MFVQNLQIGKCIFIEPYEIMQRQKKWIKGSLSSVERSELMHQGHQDRCPRWSQAFDFQTGMKQSWKAGGSEVNPLTTGFVSMSFGWIRSFRLSSVKCWLGTETAACVLDLLLHTSVSLWKKCQRGKYALFTIVSLRHIVFLTIIGD